MDTEVSLFVNHHLPAKQYLFDVEGKTIRNLEKNEYEKLIIFLDIDHTLGIGMMNQLTPVENETIIPKDRIKEIKKVNDFYVLQYYISYMVKREHTIDDDLYLDNETNKGNEFKKKWNLVEMKFVFKTFLKDLADFFKQKNILKVCLFSAAGRLYVECIRRILNSDFGFHIEDVFYAEKTNKEIYLHEDYKIGVKASYYLKDMWKALEICNLDNDKIPILFDDRDYWGVNGFVIRISSLINDISDFLDNPIKKSKGVLL